MFAACQEIDVHDGTIRDYGFRARRFAAPRNDEPRFHAQRPNAVAGCFVAQCCKKGLHRRAVATCPRSAENRNVPARSAESRVHTFALPAQWRRPSRRGSARSPRRPRCASAADWRSPRGRAPRKSPSIRTRVPEPALRLTIRAAASASAAFKAAVRGAASNRASPWRKTKPCIRRQPGMSASPGASKWLL